VLGTNDPTAFVKVFPFYVKKNAPDETNVCSQNTA
jgi:hypothetical protein